MFGLRTSAIRYYEQIGILPPPLRKNGQRCYDKSVTLPARGCAARAGDGIYLDEIRELFFGFEPGTSSPKRWHQVSKRKIAELRNRMKRLKMMETLLKRMEKCHCAALEECGEKLLQ